MIRKIEINDKDEYIDMCMDFYSGDAVMGRIPVENIEKTFALLIKGTPFAQCFVDETGGVIRGYILLALTWSQEAGGIQVWLEEIYIKPEYRGEGIGSSFIEYVKENIPAARYRLETEPENHRAQKLYKQHGFSKMEYINFGK